MVTHLHEPELRFLLESEQGEVARRVRRVAEACLNRARQLCPVDQGTLRASLSMAIQAGPGQVVGVVGSPLFYAKYVHDGTGIYGPRGVPIRPVSAKVLAWPARNGGGNRNGMIFAKQVKGQKPTKFLVRALQQTSPWPVVTR